MCHLLRHLKLFALARTKPPTLWLDSLSKEYSNYLNKTGLEVRGHHLFSANAY